MFYCYGDHRDLHVLTHSFPTRRSSDLHALHEDHRQGRPAGPQLQRGTPPPVAQIAAVFEIVMGERSEEHTSELQSLMRISYAVFCLKKKNMNTSPESAPTTP